MMSEAFFLFWVKNHNEKIILFHEKGWVGKAGFETYFGTTY